LTNIVWIAAAVAVAAPALVIRLSGIHLGAVPEAALYGLAILGAAFLLSWCVEVAQKDMAQAFAVAILALVAVLPEYAIDVFFAYTAAERPEYAAYAAANMTGANRLLVGVGWPLIAVLFWLRTRARALSLRPEHRLELTCLGLATVYAFLLPLKGTISLTDAAVLVGLFGLYFWATTRGAAEEPQLAGPAALLGRLSTRIRRSVTAALFLLAGGVILAAAEPFAEGLIASGKHLGVDEFLLVQWLAPLASEAPEVVIAAIFTLRGQAIVAMGALLSSKINQWTLLIGTLPVAYSVGLGRPGALPLGVRQAEEVLLTVAQSLFAVVLLTTLRFSLLGAAALFLLFASQLAFPDHGMRLVFSGVYLIATIGLLLHKARRHAVLSVCGTTVVGLAKDLWSSVRSARTALERYAAERTKTPSYD